MLIHIEDNTVYPIVTGAVLIVFAFLALTVSLEHLLAYRVLMGILAIVAWLAIVLQTQAQARADAARDKREAERDALLKRIEASVSRRA